MVPFGATIVNVTLAPDAGTPPLSTAAEIGTVPGREKAAPAIVKLALRAGAATTVALAVSTVFALDVDAVRLTAYVPAGVPVGAPFPNPIEAL